MFIVFTKPNKFTKTYTEAYQIAEDHYQSTGEIVAVEKSELGADYEYLLSVSYTHLTLPTSDLV